MDPTTSPLYLYRAVIGLLFCATVLGWFLAVRAGDDLDRYWQQLHWTQKMMAHSDQERQVQIRINAKVRALFDSLNHCSCDGDPQTRSRLWSEFMALLDEEETLGTQGETLLAEWEALQAAP